MLSSLPDLPEAGPSDPCILLAESASSAALSFLLDNLISQTTEFSPKDQQATFAMSVNILFVKAFRILDPPMREPFLELCAALLEDLNKKS